MKVLRNIFLLLFISVVFISSAFSQTDEYNKAKGYFDKGLDFYSKMQLDSALNNFQQASIIFKKAEKWNNYLICEYYCGQILLTNGNFDFAQKVYENIETVSNEKIGKSNDILAATYSSLGQIYFHKADLGMALDYFDKTLNLQLELKGDSSIEVANVYNSIGNVLSAMGEYDMALENYDKNLEISQKFYGENSPELATTLNNIAIIYSSTGQYSKSLEIRQKILNIVVGENGENNIESAEAYSGIGKIYCDKGENDLAKDYVLKSIEIKKKLLGENNYKIADDYIQLGIIYESTGDYEKAQEYYFMALEIKITNFGENHPDISIIYNNLGLVAKNMKSYSNALSYFNIALDIKKANYGDFHPEVALIYTNIATLNFDQKDYASAQENLERAISIIEAVFGDKNPNLVEPYLNLANIYYESLNDEQALYYFQKSLIANIIDFYDEDYNVNPKAENYYNLTKLLESFQGKAKAFAGKFNNTKETQNLEISCELYQLCDTLIDKIRQSTTTKTDKIAVGIKAAEIYGDAITTCLTANKVLPSDNYYLKMAFYFSEKNKAGTLLEAISGAQAQKFAGIPDSLLEQEKYLSEQIAYYEKQLAELPDVTLEEFYRNQLFINNENYRELIIDLEHDFPKYYEMKYSTKTASVSDIQQMLSDSTALRSYFLSDSIIYIFTITKNEIKIDISQKPEDVENQVQIFNSVITSSKSQNLLLYQKLAYNFYQLLFPTSLDVSIKKLIIIPDGILGTISFEALFTSEYSGELKAYNTYPFLIKNYAISYSYSANLLYSTFSNTLSLSRPAKDFLGIAPVFGEKNITYFNKAQVTELPGSEEEVNSIQEKFILNSFASDILINKDASETKIKYTNLTDYKFIHIATHGFVNSETPELSGLLLSKNDISGDDGVLYTGEIYNLKLNSDIVIMSACETGLGKISKGEGVIGLSRAILYAGSKNIIVSLWQVSDASTSQLMLDFYTNIFYDNGSFNEIIDFSDYMHFAKLKMIEENLYSHPYFWSAFILIGK